MLTWIKVLLVSVLAVHYAQCISLKERQLKEIDSEFDWRQRGVISPVTDQGQMGAAIAFVIAEGVESLHAIETGQPVVVLSRQEVADCCLDSARQPRYRGFDCITHIKGLCTEASYKHSGVRCNSKTCPAVGKVTSTGYLPRKNESLMVEIIHQTTLSAFIDASHTSFQTYTAGVYNEPNCSEDQLDHVVQIVGYGSTSYTGEDYWIIKNSWGVNWGEKGYMKIARGKNMCGIASSVFYPINKK